MKNAVFIFCALLTAMLFSLGIVRVNLHSDYAHPFISVDPEVRANLMQKLHR